MSPRPSRSSHNVVPIVKESKTMKPKKYYLIFGVIIGVLCAAALAQIESPRYDEHALIASPNPVLAGIKQLDVVITTRGTDPNKDGLDSKGLKAEVERSLEKAGIKKFMPSEVAVSLDLKVSIEMLNLGDSQQCVFRVQTSLSRVVRLNEQRDWLFKANVWTTEPVMQIEQLQNISGKVIKVVLQQVDAFIQAHRIVNQSKKQVSDANDMASVSVPVMKEPSQQPAKKVVAEYKYVASKNSDVFHTPNCRSAKRILPENMVGYSSREEAITAGKKPCKLCKP
jgi:hypothetical protein